MKERSKLAPRELSFSSSVLAIALSLVLLSALSLAFPHAFFIGVVWAADSYGNDIEWIDVSQYNTTSWNQVYNFTGNGTTRIHDSWETSFLVQFRVNKTLMTEAEVLTYCSVNCTITHQNSTLIWDNVALNVTGSTTSDATYYYAQRLGNWTSSLPEAGVVYNCTFVYKAYF